MGQKIKIWGIGFLFFIGFWAQMICGCSHQNKSQSVILDDNSFENSSTSSGYYDFPDILIPSELKVVKKSTMMVLTPGKVSGILTLKGGVEGDSLMQFFNIQMVKDNWRIVSIFKSPEATKMLFQKENRWGIISIFETRWNTYVEIVVAPSISDTKTSSLAD
ncbi:MAG: hypothetical protein HQK77_04080 [Desulfobacterales bacterium]|nr:hypothetical protein [Desulfobacterales bacterium]